MKQLTIHLAYKTRAGQYSTNLKKTNQDTYFTYTKFMQQEDCYYLGVFDGHGEFGHKVSSFLKKNLPTYVQKEIKSQGGWENNKEIDVQKVFKNSLQKTNSDLINSTIDTSLSGSTSVSVLIKGNKLWCANVGDSRAILVKQKQGVWSNTVLSIDHKPDLFRENQRILEAGGRIEKQKDEQGNEYGPLRVWQKKAEIPGLAMTRSMGDQIGRLAGIIAEPDLLEHKLNQDDKIIIIASDGVWEFQDNTTIANFVIPYYENNDPKGAVENVVRQSVDNWLKEDDVIDDITCIVIFLYADGIKIKKKVEEYF